MKGRGGYDLKGKQEMVSRQSSFVIFVYFGESVPQICACNKTRAQQCYA